ARRDLGVELVVVALGDVLVLYGDLRVLLLEAVERGLDHRLLDRAVGGQQPQRALRAGGGRGLGGRRGRVRGRRGRGWLGRLGRLGGWRGRVGRRRGGWLRRLGRLGGLGRLGRRRGRRGGLAAGLEQDEPGHRRRELQE